MNKKKLIGAVAAIPLASVALLGIQGAAFAAGADDPAPVPPNDGTRASTPITDPSDVTPPVPGPGPAPEPDPAPAPQPDPNPQPGPVPGGDDSTGPSTDTPAGPGTETADGDAATPTENTGGENGEAAGEETGVVHPASAGNVGATGSLPATGSTEGILLGGGVACIATLGAALYAHRKLS